MVTTGCEKASGKTETSETSDPRFLPVVVLSLMLLLVAGPVGAAEQPATAVPRWLVLGPAPQSLPVFHDEKPGGVTLTHLMDTPTFGELPAAPRQGERMEWPGGGFVWTGRDAAGGRVTLDPPKQKGRAAEAWLAVYLDVDRFTEADLDVTGTHPRRAWLDGVPVADEGGGKQKNQQQDKKDGDSVHGKLKLVTGHHLLLVRTVFDPEHGAPWTVGATLRRHGDAPSPKVQTSLDPTRPLTILDVLDATRITSVAVAPDGKKVALVLRRFLPGTDESESWVEIRSTSDGTPIRTLRGDFGIERLTWDPTGRRVAYVTREKNGEKKKGDDSGDGKGKKPRATLWIADADLRTAQPLVERVERLGGFLWAPDGASIVYSVSFEPEPGKLGVRRRWNLLDRMADYRTRSYLYRVLVPAGTRRRLTAGQATTVPRSISPDGKRLLFTRSLEDLGQRPYVRQELWELDLNGGGARKLRDSWWMEDATYAPDGRRILLRSGPSEFGPAGKNLPEGVIPNDYDMQLYIWDPDAGDAQAITRTFHPSVAQAVWSRADGDIYLRAEDHDRVRLFRYRVATRTFDPLDTPGADVLRRMDVAWNAPVAVVAGTSPWTPQSVLAVDLTAGSSRFLFRPAECRFHDVTPGTLEPWNFTASSGRTIEGRVYLPPGFDPHRRYPAIVYYYGGTSPVTRDFGGRYPKEWWSSNGYVVYVLEPSGATGYGQAFSALHVNDWGKIVSGEIIEGTRRFLKTHPYVDPKRVGCIGASYGGFMTELLVTQTDLFTAAVSHAGISSISSYWGEGYWGYNYNAVSAAGSFPWNRRDIYVDQSPLFHADRVKTPLLMMHGLVDTNVPVGESETYYTALKLLGAPVEYVTVAGENHWILSHDHRKAWSETIVAWFDRWLKDRPEWWNDLYPGPR